MGNCKDCRNWEQRHDIQNRKWSECNAVDWVVKGENIGDADMALYAEAHDDSDLNAGLKTGAMFGCVQFQKRSSV